MSALAQFYKDKVLFITGCTGFLGKVLLEKILRCVPQIQCVYVMIRQKRGSSLNERFKREILDSQCFDRLRQIHDKNFDHYILSKVIPIEGDMLKDQLGLAQVDLDLILNKANIVINCAASVDFNARIDDSILINIRGTQRIYNLAKNIKHLDNFIHISTAYVNSDKIGWIEEKIYDPNQENLETYVQQLLKTPVSILEKKTKDILGDFPNTYTFTKCLAEKLLIQDLKPGFPLTLIRPSIIGASWKDPIPGWIDSLVASSAIFFFVGLGLLKTLNGDVHLIGDQVPVDYVADFIVAAGAYYGTQKEFTVLHCCSSARNPMTWSIAKEQVEQFWSRNPSSQQFQKPNVSFHKNDNMYKVMTYFKNAPALLYYQLAQRVGNKEMKLQAKRLKKMIDRAEQINNTFRAFIQNEWIFDSGRSIIVQNYLNAQDEKHFNLDIEQLNWRKYLDSFNWGIQKFLLKENIPNPQDGPTDVLNKMLDKQSYFSDIQWCLTAGESFNTKTTREYTSLVMNSQRVQSVIKQLVEEKSKKYQNAPVNFDKLHQNIENQGIEICKTMFADYNMKAIRMFAWFLTKIFRQIYEKVIIDEQALLALQNHNQKANGPLIFMPTHRSHVDFLLCSYIFFSYKIKCPHIAAADDVLSVAVAPIILRAGGAFFIKRKNLQDKRLYQAIFSEYVTKILMDECYLEFFVEGTRSRTGKALQPKFGLLNVICEGVFEKKIPDATIVPITINYEKILEQDTYPFELLGEEKVKESLLKVLKVAHILLNNFGRIEVRFGKNISIKQWAKINNLNCFENINNRRKCVESLGYEISYTLIDEMVVMPTTIISALLLMSRRGLKEDYLIKGFDWLYKEIQLRKARTVNQTQVQSDSAVRNSVQLLKDLVEVKKKNVFDTTIIPKQEYKSILMLSYYRNQLVHIFFSEGVICCALNGFGHQLSHKEGIAISRLWEECDFLLKLLEKEYLIRNKLSSENQLQQLVSIMVSRGVLNQKDDTIRIISNYGQQTCQFVCSLIWPLVECYWATIVYLYSVVRAGTSIELDELIGQIQAFTEQMYGEHIIEHYESCSIETIKNAIHNFKDLNVLCLTFKEEDLIVTIIITEEQILAIESQIKRYLKHQYTKSVQNPIYISKLMLDFSHSPKL